MTGFAALEDRVNSAVLRSLSNASSTLGGVAVDGIFDLAYELSGVGLAGMASSAPSFTLATSDVPANPAGASLIVNDIAYTVIEHRPDGTGLSVLLLERAA